MKPTKLVQLICSSVVLGLAVSAPLYADHHKEGEKLNEKKDMVRVDDAKEEMRDTRSSDVKDAWREGKLESAFLFNTHLNNFKIDPDVNGSKVLLTGKVNSQVEKDLAGAIAEGIDGIVSVDNQLTVIATEDERVSDDAHGEKEQKFAKAVRGATLVAEIKTKLLANGSTSGLAINVDVEDGDEITLRGEVKSEEVRALAGQIAKNVDGVDEVDNELKVVNS